MASLKVAILGAKGMLGTDLTRLCQENNFTVLPFDLPEFDITSKGHLEKVISNADAVVNCAAYTNVEQAQVDKDLAYQVNGDAVGTLGQIAADLGKWVLHISTDFVFDGSLDRPYKETDQTNPINAYGQSKFHGEKLLAQSGCESCILRIEWTYGTAGNNFISKLITFARQGKPLKIVDDQVGSPTSTEQVSKAICKILTQKPEGIFHFASTGYVSRFNMAKFMFEKLSINANLSPCKSSEYTCKAKRPLNSRFDCGKIQSLLDEPVEHWQVSLERYLKQL